MLAGGDKARVHFFPCDLLGGATMLTAVRGCSGSFHLASPCIINRVLNPEVLLPCDRPAVVPSEFRPLSTGGRLSCFVAAEGAGGVAHGGDAQCAAHRQGRQGRAPGDGDHVRLRRRA